MSYNSHKHPRDRLIDAIWDGFICNSRKVGAATIDNRHGLEELKSEHIAEVQRGDMYRCPSVGSKRRRGPVKLGS